MIHNGIEYGLMQSFAEGFDILRMRRPTRCRKNIVTT
jgi:6-phosphogluconate dehydrogenase (decarboxylating)